MLIAFGIAQTVLLARLFLCRTREQFAWWAAFVLPLQGLAFDVGILLSWYKVILPLAIVTFMVHRWRLRPLDTGVLVLFAYVTVLTALFWWFDASSGLVDSARLLGWGPAQTTYRHAVQWSSFICLWGLASVAQWCVSTQPTAIRSITHGYVVGNVVSIVAGLYQVAASIAGLPWIAVEETRFLSEDASARSALYIEGLPAISRLQGLGGEPKHTGSFALLALVLLLFAGSLTGVRARVRGSAVGVLVLGSLLTFSTATWIGLAILLMIFVLYNLRSNSRLPGVLAVTLAFFVWTGIAGSVLIMEVFEQRISNRLVDMETIKHFEPKDGALIEYLRDEPLAAIFGHGTGGVDFRLIPYVVTRFLDTQGTVTPTYVLPRLLGDIGLVGILIVVGIVFRWFRSAGFHSGAKSFIFVGAVLLLVVTHVGMAGYILVAGSLAVAKGAASLPSRNSDS